MAPVRPLARNERLLVKYLADEVLVYDLNSDKAHCLNQTAGLVWKYCDGKNTTGEIRESIEKEKKVAIDERIVWLALVQLQNYKLLQGCVEKPSHIAGLSRRQLIRQIGVAAVSLPLIFSIVAPTAQAQASCVGGNRPDGCPCSNPGQCMPSHHCNSGICGP